jgi:hypothetical protein
LRGSNSAGAPDAGKFAYGAPGWVSVVGDWDSNGTTTVGVVDPATETWYLRNSNSAGAPNYTPFRYGAPGWIPVVGDWTGSGHTGIGVVDPATGTWYLRTAVGPGTPDAGQFKYGAPGWKPVTGDWTGSGKDGIGVVDPTTNTWYLRNENSAGAPDAGKFTYGAPAGSRWRATGVAWARTASAWSIRPRTSGICATRIAPGAPTPGSSPTGRPAGCLPSATSRSRRIFEPLRVFGRMRSRARSKRWLLAGARGWEIVLRFTKSGGHLFRLWALFLLTYPQRRQAVECLPAVEARLLNPP